MSANGGDGLTDGGGMSEDAPTGQPQPPSPPPGQPGAPPAYGPPPPGQGGPGLAWLWILLGVLVAAGVGVGAYFLLTGDDGQEADSASGDRVTVSVKAGLCDPAAGTTPIEVAIAPPNSATVTVTGGDGFQQAFTGTGGHTPVGPGDYSWTAQPTGGLTLAGESAGSLTAGPCQQAATDFTPREVELLNHIPGSIQGSCQRIPPEQALGRAAASILCEYQGATLFYDLFPNLLEMEKYYNSRVREFGVTPGAGFCDSAARAEHAYVRQRDGSDFQVGRLLCFRDGGSAVFIWTDRRVDISVEAQRSDPTNSQLYGMWADIEFGPLA
ncbi:MAG: hypothetical protein ACRDHB_04240 [Actinomycetota bacterium]